MSKRKFYPPHRLDRIMLWGALSALLVSYGLIIWLFWHVIAWGHLVVMAVGFGVLWGLVYLLQTPIPENELSHYTVVIGDIEDIGKKLTKLAEFLKEERERVAESEATVNRLKVEKIELEPVVTAHRDTVKAVLAAYTKTTASRVWKERVIGFLIGLITSLLAGLVFEALKEIAK
jgi:hypothetical protein